MSIKYLLILIFNFICVINVISQTGSKNSGKVFYEYTDRKGLYSGKANKSGMRILYFNDSSSSFSRPIPKREIKNIQFYSNDVPESVKLQITEEAGKMLARKDTIVSSYHKAGTNLMLTTWQNGDAENRYCVIDTIKEYQWKLLPDTMRVLGFLCQKATCESVYASQKQLFNVWYSPSIPVSFGPDRFYGLPGLILAIESDYYSFKAVELSLPIPLADGVKIECCKGYPFISAKERDEINAKQKKDFDNLRALHDL
jgi:GLPGLI family protein